MPGLQIHVGELTILLAIVLRLSIILFMLPIFRGDHIPNAVKACTVLALSLMLFPVVKESVAPLPLDLASCAWIGVGEIFLGLVFSLSLLLVFSGFQIAGEQIGMQMGFGFAQMADPTSGVQTTLFSMWFQLLGTLILFCTNTHHLIITALVESFRTIPVGGFSPDKAVFGKMLYCSAMQFVIAVKVAAPIIVILLAVNLGLGLMARFAPQVNILMTSFPLTILIGLVGVSICLIYWGEFMLEQFRHFYRLFMQF